LEEVMAVRRRDGKATPKPDGELRQSQVVTTFGPGAMVDLVNRAVVIGGLEHWGYGKERFVSLDDARLRSALLPRLRALDPNLDLAREDYFRMPPACNHDDAHRATGVQALEFPRWFVCQQCRRLARTRDAFTLKDHRYRHECGKNKRGYAVPVRFVAACHRGHLTDLDWTNFAHTSRDGGKCDAPKLFLHEGATGDLGRIFVACQNCGAQEAMRRAEARRTPCHGERPWLGGKAMNEPCDAEQRLLVRTASHAYFGQVMSALRLPPPEPDALTLRLRAVWPLVKNLESEDEIQMFARKLPAVASAIDGEGAARVLAAIEAERDASSASAVRPLRSEEFERITEAPLETPGVVPERGVQFAAYRVPASRVALPAGVAGRVVVPELREVRVQVSFSRFDSVSADLQGEYDFGAAKIKPASLTLPGGNEKWLPAAEVRGEGLFVELDERAVSEWELRPAVVTRTKALLEAFEKDSRGGAFPGVRFYLLHSLSHLLLTAISLECGYAASAIRERIYCLPAGTPERPMAAILLSTGTTGSEGTLGGLVEEGPRVAHHLREAWDLGRLCSNDPVCAAHDPASPTSDRRTEGAACHGCLYIAESSCERFNRYLDRALVVPTIGNDAELAYFRDRP
jgi:hypothetical protein